MTETVIIGIGGAGCRLVNKFETDYDKLYFDTDKEVLEYNNGIRITCNAQSARIEFSVINEAEGEAAVVENSDMITDTIKQYQNIIIVTFLGGPTSNGVAKGFANLCSKLNKTIKVVASLPLDFEGKRRIDDANAVLNHISELGTVKVIDNTYFTDAGKERMLSETWAIQDNKFIAAIKEFI